MVSPSPPRRRCPVAGGHSVDDPEPKYGMAVTGVADAGRLLRTDAGVAGTAAVTEQAVGHRRPQQQAQADRGGVPTGGRHHGGAQPCCV